MLLCLLLLLRPGRRRRGRRGRPRRRSRCRPRRSGGDPQAQLQRRRALPPLVLR